MRSPYDVIIKPIITETTMDGVADKRYTFKVDMKANKVEIRQAIEQIFKVKVAKVNTLIVGGKKKRQGRHEGYRPDWKKAIVTLTADSKEIEYFEGM